LILAGAGLGTGPALFAAGEATVPVTPLFSRHVVPLFSRLGCNAGACHGAVKGQNGFRLTLFGAQPDLDHSRILREASGRRLNLLAPEASLLLLKATGQVPHQGDARLARGSPEYRIIHRWIASGARLDEIVRSRVVKLLLTTTPAGNGRHQLNVQATFADGSDEDVTHLCRFEAVHKEVALVRRSGEVQVIGAGDTALVARYRAEPAVTMLVAPRQGKERFPDVQPINFIDRQVLNKLRRLNIHPAEVCDDATFLRRASLDDAPLIKEVIA
jgi:hypothetical protein